MAYYCEVTDLTRPNPGTIMIEFHMKDDADGSVVRDNMSLGFQVTRYDQNGDVIVETGDQKIARMAAEFNDYSARIITDTVLVDEHFDYLKSIAVGYRYPAAG